MQATQAAQAQPKPTDLRVPTSNWSGLGFSQSSPSAVLKEKKQREAMSIQGGDIWSKGGMFAPGEGEGDVGSSPDLTWTPSSGLSASNYLETMPSHLLGSVAASSHHPDLPSLLASLGLDKYTQLFKSHELDLATFQTLSEIDLKEIGVSTFGARRKMLLAISELNKRPFRCSAAVGAERKSSSSSNSLNENW